MSSNVCIAWLVSSKEGSWHAASTTRIDGRNDEAHPEAVIPRESAVKVEGAKLDYTFRHESITVIELHKKN